jgi:hypothetical protein
MDLFVKTYETELVGQTFIERLPAVDPKKLSGGARWTSPPTKLPCGLPTSFSVSTTANSEGVASAPTASMADTSQIAFEFFKRNFKIGLAFSGEVC